MEGVGRAKRDRRRRQEAVLGVGPGGGRPLPEGGFGGITPEKILETTLMCILETENFTFVLHVHS
jgi:hypothetical protein